jgi:hypothetical protein
MCIKHIMTSFFFFLQIIIYNFLIKNAFKIGVIIIFNIDYKWDNNCIRTELRSKKKQTNKKRNEMKNLKKKSIT